MLTVQVMSDHPYAAQLYEQYQGLWFRVAIQIVRNPDDAQDVVQEAYRKFLAVEKEWATFEDARRYFSAILTNTAIDYYKLARRRLQNHVNVEDPVRANESLVAVHPRPWDDLERMREQRVCEEVKELVGTLPVAQREAVEILYLSEDPGSLTESSRQVGVPISTLRSRALIGVDKLKKSLRKKRLI